MEVAVGLAGLSGLRRGEIEILRWSDVDFETDLLRVYSTPRRPASSASPPQQFRNNGRQAGRGVRFGQIQGATRFAKAFDVAEGGQGAPGSAE